VTKTKLLSPVCCVLVATSLAWGQEPGRTIDITVTKGAAARFEIAIPAAIASDPARKAGEEIVRALRDDLEFSGYFNVVEPRLYRLVPQDGELKRDDWLSIGADFVTRLQIDIRDGRLDLQARLFQTTGSATAKSEKDSLLFARRYGGTTDMARRVGHQLADDLILQQTGQKGVAMTRVAFVSRHGDGKEIYLMDYDGRRIRRLTTTNTINLSPVWSPSGSELAYVSWRSRQPSVYVMSSDGTLGNLNTIGGELSSAPDWSHDGRKLIYSSDASGNTELYVLDRTSGKNTKLTDHPAIDTAPAFSPNGREIAFTSDRTGVPQVYMMDAEGLNLRRISWSGSYNDSASWSPRGDRLAYVSRSNGRFDVVVLDLPTKQVTRLTHGEGNSENPSWSPDGRHLVFSSDRAGTYDIYSMRDDGKDVRRLTRNGHCFTPHWSP